MRVLLERDLYLEGVLYRAFPTGTEIPDKIGDKKVMLWDKAFQKKKLQRTHDIAEKGWSDVELDENTIFLPEKAVKYKGSPEESAKDARERETALSQMHPPVSKGPPSDEKPDPNLKTTTRK